MEVWKDIYEYEGVYKISNYGNVKRLAFGVVKSERILIPNTKKSGYKFICLCKFGEMKYFHIHRLVATAFISNPENKPQVNHIDLDKSNNCVENLEWVNQSENQIHARANKIFKNGAKKGFFNSKSYQVAQIFNKDIVYLWGSISDICLQYNIVPAAIHKAIRNNSKSIGYGWVKVDKSYYIDNKNKFNKIPKHIVDKRKRDMTKPLMVLKEKRKNKYTKDYLIINGVKCFEKYGRLIRKEYDIFAKQNDTLTYIPISNRFDGWLNFKQEVVNNLLKKY